MVEEPERKPCDVDDILCQLEALSHLKGLRAALGDEQFKSSFPELEGLDEKLTQKIKEQEISVGDSMAGCGLPMLSSTELVSGTEEKEEEQ